MTFFDRLTAWVAGWGALYFAIIFIVALAHALRPSNGKAFEQAANIPLRED